MKSTTIEIAVTALVLVALSSCGPSATGRYTNIRTDVQVEAILPPPPNPPMWTQEDLDKFAFVAPTNVSPGDLPWTPILRGGQLSALEYRRGGGGHGDEIHFRTTDHGLIRSMSLTLCDRGPVLFRVLAGGKEVARFEDALGMGFGKGGYILCLSISDRKEGRRIVRQLREP